MTDRVETLRVVGCLLEDLKFLRSGKYTRLNGYSTQFLLEIRKELQEFSTDLGGLINRQMLEQTGDTRPFIVVNNEPRRLP